MISRARHDVRIYTDDAEAMRRAVARTQDKELALEAVKLRPTQGLRTAPGMRI